MNRPIDASRQNERKPFNCVNDRLGTIWCKMVKKRTSLQASRCTYHNTHIFRIIENNSEISVSSFAFADKYCKSYLQKTLEGHGEHFDFSTDTSTARKNPPNMDSMAEWSEIYFIWPLKNLFN